MATLDLLGRSAGCFLHMRTGFGQHYGEAAVGAERRMPTLVLVPPRRRRS